MRIYVDITEPGTLFQSLRVRGESAGIPVEKTILHKRPGSGGALRGSHPLYGLGTDYIIVDDELSVVAAIERKATEDIAKAVTLESDPRSNRLFRQVKELAIHPTPILLLEGTPSALYRRVEPVIMGFQFWCARQGVSIIYTSSPASSARAVYLIARKLASEFEGGARDVRAFSAAAEETLPKDDPDEFAPSPNL